MQCYTELISPTGVTQALSLPFTSASANNLVIAKSSVLQVFALKHIETGSETKLVLVSEHHVAGTITALSRVKILNSKSGGEAVLVAVRDAKLSLVEWDPELHDISTVSIHYYESEDLQRNPWAPHISQCATHLTVDPSSRCAAFNFGQQNLAILPFHQLGDDLVMGEYESDIDGDKPDNGKASNGDAVTFSTPYAASFVLSLTTIDPGLLHPIDFAFLHEYREPTFGILYTTNARSQALAHERKDFTHYAVFTLDLDQKASTTLLSISKLPNDLYKVIALPPPVGGTLLLGANELVHIDQGGKANSIAVNGYARQCSTFPMADGASLNLRLEGSQVVPLGPSSSDLFLVLSDGTIALVTFKLDGRTVSTVQLQPLQEDVELSPLLSAASCSANIGPGLTFVGSENTDSVLLGWTRSDSHVKRHNSKAALRRGDAMDGNGDAVTLEDDDEEDDLDEDLYGPGEEAQPQHSRSIENGMQQRIDFTIHDRLMNIGPIRDMAFGTRPRLGNSDLGLRSVEPASNLELALSSGRGKAGSITVLSRELDPETNTAVALNNANGVWSVQIRDRDAAVQSDNTQQYDQYMIVSTLIASGEEESTLYRLSGTGMDRVDGTEFDPSAGGTIAVGSIGDGTRVVQALSGELRSYDSAFGLSQIHPVVDEDTGSFAQVISVSFADPYVLVLRDDSTVVLLQADKSGDLEECNLPDYLMVSKWLSGCLYKDSTGLFGDGIMLFLMGADGSLSVFDTSSLEQPIYTNKGIGFLPARLTPEPIPKHWRQQATLTEILVADIGDTISSTPYMFLRTSTDDIVMYQPYRALVQDSLGNCTDFLAFKKSRSRLIPKSPAEAAEEALEADTVKKHKPMIVLPDFGGLRTVFMPGTSPTVVVKTSRSLPQMYQLRTSVVKAMTALHTSSCPHGFAFIDETGYLRSTSIETESLLGGLPWLASKKQLGTDIANIAFSPRTGTYALATSDTVDFQLPQDDEWHPDWQGEQLTLAPQVERSSLRVLSRKTWNFISTYQFDNDERVLCLKTINLEVSEESHERKDLLVVGTAITKGEDLSIRGALYIFDVVDVAPEPGIEETDLKLKLIAKEDVKGAVTALSQVGSQGYLIAAQGQKCMVRGLKEDNTILPVAFLDMNYYVNVIKELKGTGLCILGDACHGLWFTGYSEEPYKLQVFGRDYDNMEVMAADFLPMGKQLYIISADGDCDLHVFQYDPEDPQSVGGTQPVPGTRLMHRSTFHTGYFPSCLSLIPRTPVSSELARARSTEDMDVDLNIAEQNLLLTTQEGAIALITPLSEQAYRRLSTLQNLLVTNLEHPCGLNPRAFRSVETTGLGGRGMLDGDLLWRWLDQGSQHQESLADRIGATIWDIRGDLEAMGGAGLGYV